MRLLQAATSLGPNGIANVMRGIASAWEDPVDYAVLDSAGTEGCWSPRGVLGRRRVMALWPGPVVSDLAAWMRDRGSQAVLAHYPPLDGIVFRAATRLGLPRLYYCHNVTPSRFYEGAERSRREQEIRDILQWVKQADAVVCNSRFTADWLQENAGVTATPAPPAVDARRFTPVARSEDGLFRLITLGRGVPHKGLRELLEALRPLLEIHDTLRLDVVGRLGNDGYARTCRQLLDHPRIRWHDHARDDDVARLLAEADVFVSGSRFEGFGMPFLEAASCGTPSLGFRCAAIPEAVLEGRTGRLVDEGDWVAFTDVLEAWIEDPSEPAALAASCREHALERTWSQVVTTVAGCFKVTA